MARVFRICLAHGLISSLCFSQSAVNAASSPSAAPVPAAPNPLGDAPALYGKGAFEPAIEKYQEFIKDHPNSPDGFAGLVRTYLKLKNVEEASKTADQGIAQANHPRMRATRAEAWFRQGKIAEPKKSGSTLSTRVIRNPEPTWDSRARGLLSPCTKARRR